MWGGRFAGETDPGFLEFSSSIGFDARLYPYDIECTAAWTYALEDAGVLSGDEAGGICGALETVRSEFDDGIFEFEPSDEDIHTAVERRLVELVGSYGGKVRTGRSRNDQVATDMRLFLLDACPALTASVRGLQEVLADKAEEYIELVIPGHTHLQQAQPVLLAHTLLAFLHMLERDVALLNQAASLADILPLGSGALAGTGIAVDRGLLAERLGFSGVSENSLDAVSDRDFVCAALFALTMTMVHLSRLSEQVILWCSSEFGLARLDDSWASGSSLMPQKKNPDGPELVRGKTGRVAGSLMAMLTVMKGLPLAYNRDLQEDKEGLFDAVDTVAASLAVMKGTLGAMTFDAGRAAALSEGGFMTATDLADYLASKGMEFPEAHRLVGEVVAYCVNRGIELTSLSAAELSGFSDELDEEALSCLGVDSSLARRSVTGGTAPESVRRQLARAREMIAGRAP